jgi:hypothetical protein
MAWAFQKNLGTRLKVSGYPVDVFGVNNQARRLVSICSFAIAFGVAFSLLVTVTI